MRFFVIFGRDTESNSVHIVHYLDSPSPSEMRNWTHSLKWSDFTPRRGNESYHTRVHLCLQRNQIQNRRVNWKGTFCNGEWRDTHIQLTQERKQDQRTEKVEKKVLVLGFPRLKLYCSVRVKALVASNQSTFLLCVAAVREHLLKDCTILVDTT